MSTTFISAADPHRPARTEAERGDARRDFYAFALWVLVTFVQFRFDELLLYPLALYFTYAAWRNQVQILGLLRRSWILLSFPVWCLISPLWAVEPAAAFKEALYLMLTMLICYQVAASLTPRQIMYAVLLATGIIVVANLLKIYGSGDGSNGIFVHKNQMGKNMVVAWIVATAVMLDPGSARKLRWIAGCIALLAAYSAFISGSATAVLLVLGTAAVNLFGATMLRGGLLRARRLAVLCLMVGSIFGAATLVLPHTEVDPVEPVLEAFGKDRSLTGRTGLWEYAEQQISAEPFLGVGSGGFWRYHDSPLVRRIFEEYYKGPRAKFNFHNSFFEISVHQGLIGLGLAILSTLWAFGWLIRGAFSLASMSQIYFFSQSLAVIARMFTESGFLAPFVIFHMLFWIGALSASKSHMERARSGRSA
ncbi:O-antigen ligase family protein [Ruegeria sp. 2012CJ41-6]|uniref:O-antigen ligase family protein n=1 Tax=Ruegeria spongiae TaxID=2942209 RepID=A0ABT0Q617_9RHOB|nr:O-antigen ligase family protein [Ruegeria spongiae]MCL6285288.1 O-antigen ligase family protein [Ruegeria spongiae]